MNTTDKVSILHMKQSIRITMQLIIKPRKFDEKSEQLIDTEQRLVIALPKLYS